MKRYLISLLIILSGCASSYKNELKFNPLEPIRVAVLPFAEVNSKGEFMATNPNLLIDNVGLVSKNLSESPRALVRKLVANELDSTALDTLSTSLIDNKLMHTGYANEKLMFDYPKLFSTSAATLCTKVLDCDAVLFGKVTRWDRSYYGVQSVTTVGVELKLISARTGEVLFSSDAKDSDSRGLTKIPTGFSSIVLEPIKGLDNEITIQLAQNVVQKMLEPLRTDKRPEFVQSSPPSIYSSAHNSLNGVLNHKGHLTVMLVGTSGNRATFSIGDAIKNLPMLERDPGHYVGEYRPLGVDRFDQQVVTVALADQFGRSTAQKLAEPVTLQ